MHLNYGRWCKDNLDDFKEVVDDILTGKSQELGLLLGSFDGKNNRRQIVDLNPENINGECIIL